MIREIADEVAPRRIVAVHSAVARLPVKMQAFLDHAAATVAQLL